MVTRCRPHQWNLPALGDDGLLCGACGRYFDFYREMTPNIRAGILVSIERRQGSTSGDTFRDAMNAAIADAQRRRN